MIEVRPHVNYDDGFIIQGHAGFAEHGRDIVCASVSAVSEMVVDEMLKDNAITVVTSVDGYLFVKNHSEGYSMWLIDMMIRYLRKVAQDYPEHIKVFEEEE